MSDRPLLFVFTFHLGWARAPVVLAWPWEDRRGVTLEVLAEELAARLTPADPNELGPYMRAEDVRRVLAEAPVTTATIVRVVSMLEQDLAGRPGNPVLAPRQPRFLSRQQKVSGAVLSFQVVEVAK